MHGLHEADLIAGMINRSIEQIYHKDDVPFGSTILETKGLTGKGFQDVSLTVRSGEIVGLYGLIGAGRSEFVQSLFGRFPATSGQIVWQGKPVVIRSERAAMDLGIALAPESRRDQGLCLNLGVGFNINLPIFDRLTSGPIVNIAREARHADRQIKDLQIKTASRQASASSLTGGNQQKMVIGKWLNHGAKLFIFDEPTVGVDVGAREEIYNLIRDAAREGTGVLIVSSDLAELILLCDRMSIVVGGSVRGAVNRGDLGAAEELHHLIQESQSLDEPAA